jgi:hypothetical protein
MVRGAISSTSTQIYFVIEGKDYYLIPRIVTSQNLVRADTALLEVSVLRQNIDYVYDFYAFENATVSGNMTSPSGSVDGGLLFISAGNGSYFLNYTFDLIGTYVLNIKAEHNDSGYSLARAYVYVGKFPISIKILGTEYQAGQAGTVWVFAEDEQGNPVVGGSGSIQIVRNDSTWRVANITEASSATGAYFYNFTVTKEEFNYLVCVNFTAGLNFDYACSETFHVSAPSGLTDAQNATLTQILNLSSLTYQLVSNNITAQVANINLKVDSISANMINQSDLDDIVHYLDDLDDYVKKTRNLINAKWGNQTADALAALIVESKWNVLWLKDNYAQLPPADVQKQLDSISTDVNVINDTLAEKPASWLVRYGKWIGAGVGIFILLWLIVWVVVKFAHKEREEAWTDEYEVVGENR